MAVTHQWKWMAGSRLVAKFDCEAAAAGDTFAPVILTSNTAGAPTQGAELLGVAIPEYAASEEGVPVIVSEDVFEVTLASGNNPGLGDPVTIATTGEVTAWAEGSGDAVCGHVVDYDPASGGLCKIKAQFDALRYLTGLLEVDTEQLVADCVTGAKIADDAVDSEHIKDGAIDLAHMSVNSVDSDQYVDGSIDNAHLAVNSIDSDNYVDGSVDPEHLAATCTEKVVLTYFKQGDITADPGDAIVGIASGAGTITKAGFAMLDRGIDNTDELSLLMNVAINGVTIFTTPPKITEKAGGAATSFEAGDDIVVGVINAAADDVVEFDVITVDWTLARTTPDTEANGICAYVEIEYKVGV